MWILMVFTLNVLQEGWNESIVQTDQVYSYEIMLEDIHKLEEEYPKQLTYRSIGKTEFGRDIWALKIGRGHTNILLHGAHHGREWMTSMTLMKMVEEYCRLDKENSPIADILDNVTIWFVPMVNPDGVTLQQLGLDAYPIEFHPALIKMNNGSSSFHRWKANLYGIDLNRQYPAGWEHLKGVNKKPSYQFYKGEGPMVAKEVKAIVHFTRMIKPEIAASFHSSGKVLFWGVSEWDITFKTEDFIHDYITIAEGLSELTGYSLEEPTTFQQGGGFTDWFVDEIHKPAVTIEIGNLIEENSLPLHEFPQVWSETREVGLFLAERAWERVNR